MPNVERSGNPANLVVVVAGALGLGTAQVLATHKLCTRGTRVFASAKNKDSPKRQCVSSYVLLNKNATDLLTIL